MGKVTVSLNGQGYGTFWITLTNGVFQLDGASPLRMSGNSTINDLSITSVAIAWSSRDGFSGWFELPIAPDGGTPRLEVRNFPGEASVSWMSENGPQDSVLTPGAPVELSGLVDW